MLSISKLFENTKATASKKGWDKVFVLIDVHETIMKSDYTNDSTIFQYYPDAIECLQLMSVNPFYNLILWTSTSDDRANEYKNAFQKEGHIVFDQFNENKEVANTDYADFSKKPYFNIIIDDKAGFDATTDWTELKNHLESEMDNEAKQQEEDAVDYVHLALTLQGKLVPRDTIAYIIAKLKEQEVNKVVKPKITVKPLLQLKVHTQYRGSGRDYIDKKGKIYGWPTGYSNPLNISITEWSNLRFTREYLGATEAKFVDNRLYRYQIVTEFD